MPLYNPATGGGGGGGDHPDVDHETMRPAITDGGLLGTARTVSYGSVSRELWLIGTLSANLAVTSGAPTGGSVLRIMAVQDATGGRTLSVDGTAVVIPTGPDELVMVTVSWVSSTVARIEAAGVGDIIPVVTYTGSATAVAADVGKKVHMSSASATTYTYPTNASVPIAVGKHIQVARWGTGAVTVVAASGVTARSEGGMLGIRAQYTAATIQKVGTDEIHVYGALA